MNQKVIRYGLIAGVVLVWGLILQQVFSAMGDDSKIATASTVDTSGLINMPADTFSLLLNYDDPFIQVEDTTEIESAPAVVVTQPIPEQKPDISFIKYMGMITNKEKRSRVAIINFKGHDMMVHEEQDVEDITIKKVSSGMLRFMFRNKIYSVQKTNQ